MFGHKKEKKKKERVKSVEIYAGGLMLFKGELLDVKIKEESVLQKSIEFFNDSAPCYIHRSAVIIRLLNELWDKLEENGGDIESEFIEYPANSKVRIAKDAFEANPAD
ncbi:MAG: hypothetical protein LBU32_29695 [Clostridiales bacterium]|nr:hypothetical protein [Clostridiales bacterium]